MSNNLHILKLRILLLAGGILVPFFSFCQQEETTNRVSIVVSVKELTPTKEIIQLPANNTPILISKANVPHYKRQAKPTKPTVKPIKERNLIKEIVAPSHSEIAAKANKEPNRPKTDKPVLPAPIKAEKKQIAINKPQAPTHTVPSQPSEDLATAKPNIRPQETKQEKRPSQVQEKTEVHTEVPSSIKAENERKEKSQTIDVERQNSISYIWIGAFLILAGIVLGLLFGRPAFLVSFVGIIFIALGLAI
ncbi:hypothetical protein [Pedobacter sp. ASV28]|uniref:hypothetical protein n=1 Tax=Pedobacter sp. ASV28 TaxID=2795123 RepID=UPI0018EB9FA1|nr:hypothetical protein [Pedobacter sp. ASV28]